MRRSFVWYAGVAMLATLGAAQDSSRTSCDEFLLPPREAKGKRVGPQSSLW